MGWLFDPLERGRGKGGGLGMGMRGLVGRWKVQVGKQAPDAQEFGEPGNCGPVKNQEPSRYETRSVHSECGGAKEHRDFYWAISIMDSEMGRANGCKIFFEGGAAGGGHEGALKGLGAGFERVNDFLGKAARWKTPRADETRAPCLGAEPRGGEDDTTAVPGWAEGAAWRRAFRFPLAVGAVCAMVAALTIHLQ